MTSYCVHLNLKEMLGLSDAEFNRLFGCNVSLGGKPLEAHEVKFYFEKMQADGYEVAPLGTCRNFDKVNGCQGHKTKPKRPTTGGKSAGGHARAAKLTPERRKEIAQKAVAARWRKPNDAG
jgi:hypothetical protein